MTAQQPPAAPPVPEHVVEPVTRLERHLARVPGLLASKAHQLFLVALGVWLIVVPIVPGLKRFAPSAEWMLIGGNWTNVSSALGACIAAGASIAAHHEAKKRRSIAELTHAKISDLHDLHIGGGQP